MHLISDQKLLEWVGSFIKKYMLAGEKRKVVVGLSGGMDSMLLSHICEALLEKGDLESVRHIHLDHCLRSDSSIQAHELKQWSEEWFWNFENKQIKGRSPNSNIEAVLRNIRRDILLASLERDEVLFLAHHIDDSFEWFLRQLLNSSKGNFTFGIPLINGKVRRPLHCLTRKQIENFVASSKIPFLIDSSNDDQKFQRNALRKQVKTPLLKMFPKGLAHYVERSNSWARENSLREKTKSEISTYFLSEDVICLAKKGGSFRDHENEIIQSIKSLSSKERGEIRQNLEKLYHANETHGRPGPFHFSGGVYVRLYGETLLFFNNAGCKTLTNYCKYWINKIKSAEIPKESLCSISEVIKKKGGLPFCLYPSRNLKIPGLKKDPIFQDLIDFCQHNGFSLRPIVFLEKEIKKVNSTSSRNLKVVPLLS